MVKHKSFQIMNTRNKLSFSAIIIFFIHPGVILSNDRVDDQKNYKQLELHGVLGPESTAFDAVANAPIRVFQILESLNG